jgi:hypothetical protein
MTARAPAGILPHMARREAASDDFYETPSLRKRSKWVVATVILLTVGMVVLPFVWAFTAWL